MPLFTPRTKELLEKLSQELDKEFEAELSKRLAHAKKVPARKSRSASVRKSRAKKAP
jgi:hypothetical protein